MKFLAKSVLFFAENEEKLKENIVIVFFCDII